MRSRLPSRQVWEVAEKWLNELTTYPPSGCARCGRRERHHRTGRPRTREDATGPHHYKAPPDELIKQRMWDRRQDRDTIRRNT